MSTESRKRYAVGVDFGGTSVKMGLVNEAGVVLKRHRFETRNAATIPAWIEAARAGLAELTRDLKEPVAGIGIGVPGFVDYGRGLIYELPNVPGWKLVELATLLGQDTNLKIRVDNDVNVMALGECTFGAGRTYQHAVFVTLGTGVGGGLLINNQLYRGAYFMAGEIGHITIDMNGIKSPQGQGGLEQYIGNRRLVARTIAKLEAGEKSLLDGMCGGDRTAITVEMIGEAARKGDLLSLGIFDYLADCLAAAFSSVAYLIQPQAFIVGGGISLNGSILFEPLRAHLNRRLSPVFAERVEIKPAALGNDAGIIGGATLALLD